MAATLGMFLQRSAGAAGMVLVFWLGFMVLMVAAAWTVFTKAGHPGWAALVPIYNLVILCRIAGRPGWWVLLWFIPLVNLVIGIMVSIDIAKNFGKGTLFGLGVAFLGFIFVPVLAWGDATYDPLAR